MDEAEMERLIEQYLSSCSLEVEHDNGEGYYNTAKLEVTLKSPTGATLLGGTAYMSTFEKAKSQDW